MGEDHYSWKFDLRHSFLKLALQRLLRWQMANAIEHWTLLVTISCLESGDCTQLPNHMMHIQSIMALFHKHVLTYSLQPKVTNKCFLFSHFWMGCMDLELQVLAWWLNFDIWKAWKLHKFPCHYWSSVPSTNEMWHYESSSNNLEALSFASPLHLPNDNA
jgi:hypothetical protein